MNFNGNTTLVVLFENRLGLCFLMSKKEGNAVKLRQYLEIFYDRFVQVRGF